MCGIVGIYDPRRDASGDRELLRKMRDALSYRGPDAHGEYYRGPIALGHRRLSIIDLNTGAQPLISEDGRYVIVFNGEIYNYRELRKRLESDYTFKTSSDTEVLLYHFIRFGVAGLSELNGMFAFAIWDSTQEELTLVRDRFGKKPLHYHIGLHGEFVFASELKSILAYLPRKPALNKLAITQYFLFEYIPGDASPFEGIHKVSPGSVMRIRKGEVMSETWWQLVPTPSDYHGSFKHAAKTFDRLLDNAVSSRMVADVPVGVLLSGGIDSSTIAWYMRQHTKELHSFSISFNEASFDESSYARLAADALATHHHDVSFTLESFTEALGIITDRLDEPLADASLLPSYIVSKEAKKKVTVVLNGDGADELLYGYDTFPAYQLAALYERMPATLQHIVVKAIHQLPTRHGYFSLDFRLKSFLRGLAFPKNLRNQIWIGSFHNQELSSLLTREYKQYLPSLYAPLEKLSAIVGKSPDLKQLSLAYLLHYLQGDILPKVDRATMYASLEARTPFLDPQLVSFILQLPQREIYSFPQGKQILRSVMARRLPRKILSRKKQGFGIPLGQWLRGPLRPLMMETLSPEKLHASGIVSPSGVSSLITEHIQGKIDHRKKLWTLMTLQWWWEKYGQ